MAIALEDVVEATTRGVLRALGARKDGASGTQSSLTAVELLQSGFFVDIAIRVGADFRREPTRSVELNPQPLPPGPVGAGNLG